VTRYDIERDVTDLLKRGLTTSHAGGFFFIPYLLQLNAHYLLEKMCPPKEHGVPNRRLALGIVFESIFGFTDGIRSIDSVSRTDFGLLFGLPFLPAPITQYRFLQTVPYNDTLSFQLDLGKRLVTLGQVKPSEAVNIDAHNIKTFSRKAMKRSYLAKEGRYGNAIRTFCTQHQESKKPLIFAATYSGTTVSQITDRIARLTRDIFGHGFVMAADKEWYCGQLIQEQHNQHGVSILTPVKQTKKRIVEFESISLDRYDQSVLGNIATLYTTMKGFDGAVRLFLKKRHDGKYFGLITPKHDLIAEVAMPTYTKRWNIEDFFSENGFLGVDRLPSLNLNAIQAMLSLRLLAFQVIDNFRHDLGGSYKNNTPKLIHRQFIDGVQGRIQLRGNTIEVNVYGFEHENAVAGLLSNINEKLEKAGVDPRIPWLRNRCLKFKFS
jgi:hypothetical protein